MPIAFIDLAAQQQRIRPQIDAAIARVLAHGAYVMGPEVRAFEDKLAAFAGSAHAVSCANGTEALALPLMAWEIGPGDAVHIPARHWHYVRALSPSASVNFWWRTRPASAHCL